jgi:HSP20 family molecular chaperone IbpA
MNRDFTRNWMWSEACEMLARAERLHHEFFRLAGTTSNLPSWEPPVDILETDREILVLVALPGVDPDHVEATIDGNHLRVAGTRLLPAQLQTATIHRLELPQGRFERRVPLPPGRYGAIRAAAANGCLVFTLQKP